METTTISVSEDLRDRLWEAKGRGESYEDFIRRELGWTDGDGGGEGA